MPTKHNSCCNWEILCRSARAALSSRSIAIKRRTVSAQLACKEWPTHKFPDVQLSIEFSQDSRSAEPPSIILKQELAGLKLQLLALIWTSGGVSNTTCFHFHLLTHSTPYLGFERISTITLSSLGKPNRVETLVKWQTFINYDSGKQNRLQPWVVDWFVA